jgi:hypothetical protein
MAAPQSDVVGCVNQFNGILKRLTIELVKRYPNDAVIDRARKRIMLAIDTVPMFVIGEVGPTLYEYRQQIYDKDEQFFIENDYDKEIRASVDAEKRDLSAYIIPKVKEAWGDADPVEKGQYADIAVDLLDCYMDYLALALDG